MRSFEPRRGLTARAVRAILHASELVVYDGREEVARHERLIAKSGTRLELDHYLEALIRKPACGRVNGRFELPARGR